MNKRNGFQDFGLTVSFVGLFIMSLNVLSIKFDPTMLTLGGLVIIVLGYLRKPRGNSNSVVGVAISPTAQKELDYLHEQTGFTAHKVDVDFSFNGHMKIKDNPEAAEIESILLKFASCGYVFTKGDVLLGKISTITSKEERVKIRRASFELIDGNKD